MSGQTFHFPTETLEEAVGGPTELLRSIGQLNNLHGNLESHRVAGTEAIKHLESAKDAMRKAAAHLQRAHIAHMTQLDKNKGQK